MDARGSEPEARAVPLTGEKRERRGAVRSTAPLRPFLMPSVDRRRLRVARGPAPGERPARVLRRGPAALAARSPPPAWYTGAGHPAYDRGPHPRRDSSMHGPVHTSPLAPVGASTTRAGDFSRRAAHGSHGRKFMQFGGFMHHFEHSFEMPSKSFSDGRVRDGKRRSAA